MTVETCPGCGERFHLFEGDDQICFRCLPSDTGGMGGEATPDRHSSELAGTALSINADKPPTMEPPVAVVALVVNPLDKGVGV